MEILSKPAHSSSMSSLPTVEVDFVGILVAIWKRKWLALVTFLTTLCLGIIFSFSQHQYGQSQLKTYHYRMALQVPLTRQDLESAKWLLENEYVPRALTEYKRNNPNIKERLSIDVSVPRNSNIIVLSGIGSSSMKDAYTWIEGQAIEFLVRDIKSQSGSVDFRMALKPLKLHVVKGGNANKDEVSHGVLIILSFFLAIFVALFAVFVANLVEQARLRIRMH
jgi:uncharacterized protein YpmS